MQHNPIQPCFLQASLNLHSSQGPLKLQLVNAAIAIQIQICEDFSTLSVHQTHTVASFIGKTWGCWKLSPTKAPWLFGCFRPLKGYETLGGKTKHAMPTAHQHQPQLVILDDTLTCSSCGIRHGHAPARLVLPNGRRHRTPLDGASPLSGFGPRRAAPDVPR